MERKDEYVTKLKSRIDAWSAQLDELDAKLHKASADVRDESAKRLADLRQQRDALKKKLAGIQGASESAWADLKQGADAAWAGMKEGLEKASSRFRSHGGGAGGQSAGC